MSDQSLGDIIAGVAGGSSSSSGGSSSSSSSSSSGSSSSSSGSSGPSEAMQRALEALRRSYLDLLRRWGLRPTKNLLNLIEKGVRSQWSSSQFTAQLRQTTDYRQHFAGIRWKEGMTEGSYLSSYAQFKARAQDIGERFTKKEFSKILKRGVTFDEFSDRVDALAAIDEYSPLWGQFKSELEQAGVNVPGKNLSKKELSKFLMGLGSAKWEAVWERAFITTNLERVAGINVVGQGETATPDAYEITRGNLLDIIKRVEALSPGFEVESLTGRDWAALGAKVREFKPNYLARYGLTTTDLLEMELGGPNAAKTADKAQRLLKEQEAFLEPRAVPMEAQQVGQLAEKRREELPQSL